MAVTVVNSPPKASVCKSFSVCVGLCVCVYTCFSVCVCACEPISISVCLYFSHLLYSSSSSIPCLSVATEILTSSYLDIYIVHMAVNQNCVWNVPRCSGRMEQRGCVTGLVPDLWSVMKYRLYIYIHI